jgi:hypothetical protein
LAILFGSSSFLALRFTPKYLSISISSCAIFFSYLLVASVGFADLSIIFFETTWTILFFSAIFS